MTGEGRRSMGWRSEELWLDTDVLWFREAPALAAVADVPLPAGFTPVETGLVASRRRRLEAQSTRRHRLATRTVPAVALVVGSATMLSIAGLRQAAAGPQPLLEDPPSLTYRLPGFRFEPPEVPVAREVPAKQAAATEPVTVDWNRASSSGLPYGGSLSDGTQLPVEGPDWVTWNPVTDSRPNFPGRLHGHERTIRTILRVAAEHRAAHPDAPRLLIGDISFPGGGVMNEHVSHQNGLDVDVYYPRLDGWLQAPRSVSQVDRALAHDLLDRFLAAGAKVVFVGYSTGLSGDSRVVPYPNHENHMHVRFPAPS